MEGPYRISDKRLAIDVAGYLVPWRDSYPATVTMAGSEDIFIPLFSTKEKLIGFPPIKNSYKSIKKITNSKDFIDSILDANAKTERISVRVAIDPYIIENGTVRYIEIISTGGSS